MSYLVVLLAIIAIVIFVLRQRAKNEVVSPDLGKADFEFRYAWNNDYIGLHVSHRLVALIGRAPNGKEIKKRVPFDDVRGISIELSDLAIEVRDLDNPIIRVRMYQKDLNVWLPRLSQAIGLNRVR